MTPARRLDQPRPRGRRAQGVVLLAFLLALALAGLGAMAAVDVWSVTRQREREQQLLFVGAQYRAAIRDYYFGGPSAGGRALPASLDALLEDDRYPVPVHHLRRLYADPITGTADWGLLMAGDGIMGVYSKSEAQPIKQAGFSTADSTFEDKSSYRDWVFAFVAGRRSLSPTTPANPASSPSVPPRPTSRKST
jgi:type II secretory pathway pseudopilin PulG